jgi:hypothetical protein
MPLFETSVTAVPPSPRHPGNCNGSGSSVSSSHSTTASRRRRPSGLSSSSSSSHHTNSGVVSSSSTSSRSTLLGWAGGGTGDEEDDDDSNNLLFGGAVSPPGSPATRLKTIATGRISSSSVPSGRNGTTRSAPSHETQGLLMAASSSSVFPRKPATASTMSSSPLFATLSTATMRNGGGSGGPSSVPNSSPSTTSASPLLARRAADPGSSAVSFNSSSASASASALAAGKGSSSSAAGAADASSSAPKAATATADDDKRRRRQEKRQQRLQQRTMKGKKQQQEESQSLSAFLSSTGHELMGVNQVNKTFPIAANLSLLCYLVLLGIVYSITPQSEWQYLPETERQAASAAFWILLVSDVLVLTKLLFQRNWKRHVGGIVYACFVCHAIAIATNLLLAYAPTVVLVDPYTHSRVFLVRWCEWIPLAGLKTYFSEGVGISKEAGGFKLAVLASLAQSLSCVSGIVFPFCKDLLSWTFWMFNAIANYLMIFPRVFGKHQRYREELARAGTSFMAQEHLERFKFSYMLMLHCTIVWFILVFMYFFNMAAHRLLPVGHVFRTDALAMIVDTVFDVIAKAVYMKLIVDVHFAVFDNEGRAQRQLAELRTLMSVLWDSSSDAIIISARRGDKVTSMLSPAFLKLAQVTLPPDVRGFKSVALLIETKLPDGDDSSTSRNCLAAGNDVLSCTYVDCSENPYDGLFDESVLAEVSSASANELQASGLISASWRHAMKEEAASPTTIENGGASTRTTEKATASPTAKTEAARSEADDEAAQLVANNILVYQFHQRQCEIKVSSNDDKNTMVAVVRDVTERHRRLEAERKAHSEIAMRQKDAQSVRTVYWDQVCLINVS